MKIKKSAIGIIAIVILIIGSYSTLFFVSTKFEDVSLAKIQWQTDPPLIAVQNFKSKEQKGTLLIRPKDGKEQFMAGEWEISPGKENLYLFQGSEAYLLKKDKVNHFTTPLSFGKIRSIQENKSGSYILIETRKEAQTNYCIARMFGEEGGKIECSTLNTIKADSNGLWNPRKKEEVVIKNTNNEIYAWEQPEPKPRFIDEKKEPELYTELNDLFNPIQKSVPQIFSLLNFMLIQKDQRFTWYQLPWGSKIFPFQGMAYLILEEPGLLSIVDLRNNQKAILFQNNQIIDQNIIVPD